LHVVNVAASHPDKLTIDDDDDDDADRQKPELDRGILSWLAGRC
jgi:hypothetical protein